jgi:hypothetical protein
MRFSDRSARCSSGSSPVVLRNNRRGEQNGFRGGAPVRPTTRGSIDDRILALLDSEASSFDDDEIAGRLGVLRQQVNQRCRFLARSRSIVREQGPKGKLVNRYLSPGSQARIAPRAVEPALPTDNVTSVAPTNVALNDAPVEWFWEGYIQALLRDHLVAQGWRLLAEADCLRRERGIDLLLERNGGRLAVDVKGFPGTTYARGAKRGQPKPTQPTLQAKHWFAEALLAAIRCQSKNPGYSVAIAFPDVPRYRSLIASTRHALARLAICAFLVQESGEVTDALPTAQS